MIAPRTGGTSPPGWAPKVVFAIEAFETRVAMVRSALDPSRLCSRAISGATNQFSMYHVDDLDRGNRTPQPPRRGSA
jgi:hypothetical protein